MNYDNKILKKIKVVNVIYTDLAYLDENLTCLEFNFDGIKKKLPIIFNDTKEQEIVRKRVKPLIGKPYKEVVAELENVVGEFRGFHHIIKSM